MCAYFCEIRTKSVGTGARSVFWRKFKMAEICLDANGRGLYGIMCHEPRNPEKKKFSF